jgi:hypothetical protein
MTPFSIKSFASASVCARLQTGSSSRVTGLLSGSAIVLPHSISFSALAKTFGGTVTPICLAAFKARRNGTRAKATSQKTMIVFLAISALCLGASTECLNRRQVYTWIQICPHSQRRRPCRLRCCKRDNRLLCMSSRLLASSLSLHFLPPRPTRAPSSDRRPG